MPPAGRFVTGKTPLRQVCPLPMASPMLLFLSLFIIAIAVYAVVRRVDVRLVLFLTALVLSTLASGFSLVSSGGLASPVNLLDGPVAVLRTFLVTLTNEQFVIPICTAM